MTAAWIRFPAPGGPGRALAARPARIPARGVLIVPDGSIDADVASLLERLADAGLHVFAAEPPDDAAAPASDAAAAAEADVVSLAAAVDALTADPATRSGAIGIVAFGAGVPLGAFLATVRPEVAVVVGVDGPVPDLSLDAWGRTDARFVLLGDPEDTDMDPDPARFGPLPVAGTSTGSGVVDAMRAAGVRVEVLAPPSGDGTPARIIALLLRDLG